MPFLYNGVYSNTSAPYLVNYHDSPTQKKWYFYSPLEPVWLTMTSLVESLDGLQYTPLYKKTKMREKQVNGDY